MILVAFGGMSCASSNNLEKQNTACAFGQISGPWDAGSPIEGQSMSQKTDMTSELVELSKLNGEFHKNYGPLLGAYLRSISVARQRPLSWHGLAWFFCSAAAGWLAKYGWSWGAPADRELVRSTLGSTSLLRGAR
jgi:hypothetical protein